MEPTKSKTNNPINLITLLVVGVCLILVLLQVGANLMNDYQTKQKQVSPPTKAAEIYE